MNVPIIDFPYSAVAQAVTDAGLLGQSVTGIQIDSDTGIVTILPDSTDVKTDTSNDTSAFYTDLVNSTDGSSVVDTGS